jgi:O-methyltransferase involved in polyketide biosynthesis
MAQQGSWDIVTGPGITALGIAPSRSVESSMPDALIDDPFGDAFVRAVDSPVPFPLRWPAAGEPATDRQAQTNGGPAPDSSRPAASSGEAVRMCRGHEVPERRKRR